MIQNISQNISKFSYLGFQTNYFCEKISKIIFNYII